MPFAVFGEGRLMNPAAPTTLPLTALEQLSPKSSHARSTSINKSILRLLFHSSESRSTVLEQAHRMSILNES